MTEIFASATARLIVKKNGGELKIVNNQTKTGIIERGGKNYWNVTYAADPGKYTITGKNPGCPDVVLSASFEEGKAYTVTFTEDCKIKQSAN